MACTTIMVGREASFDGSTIVSRNDDSPSGIYMAKKTVVVPPSRQPRIYRSKISHLTVELPDDPLSYTATPSVDNSEGIWAASGINAADVCVSATETVTSNPRVLGADPLVKYQPARGGKKAVPGGIGEEDIVVLVLPYIRSAREGVERLGKLLETYGTYESNGIIFSDRDEIWWLESIGGHHWIAARVPDDCVAVMPNQFGLSTFDFDDALGERKNYMCSADLLDFVRKYHLYTGKSDEEGKNIFNPRLAFGSASDADRVYNTPRAWYAMRCFSPAMADWYDPEDFEIPWAYTPDRLVTIEDVKYVQSSHYQGTEYDPYNRHNPDSTRGIYRPIGISRTDFCHISQIRPDAPEGLRAIEWIGFGSNPFSAPIPIFTRTDSIPPYLSSTTERVDTSTFYWSIRILAALADSAFDTCQVLIERYQDACQNESWRIIHEAEERVLAGEDAAKVIAWANRASSDSIQKETDRALKEVLNAASNRMKNSFSRSDN